MKFRTKAYGDQSYFRRTREEAEKVAKDVMARNGCGYIEAQGSDATWTIIARFEPFYGIVPV